MAEYWFDSMDLLSSVVLGDICTEYAYDGAGYRIRKTVTEYGAVTSDVKYMTDALSLYGNIIMASDHVSQETAVFTYGNELIRAHSHDMVYYYQLDFQESVTELLDEYGGRVAVIIYDEYGVMEEPCAAHLYGNIFSYTGHVYEENTGLYYAKARYYDAGAGRFISEDDYRGNLKDLVSLNYYIYCMNNPIRYTDPSGNIAIEIPAEISEGLSYLGWLLTWLDGPAPVFDVIYYSITLGNLFSSKSVTYKIGRVEEDKEDFLLPKLEKREKTVADASIPFPVPTPMAPTKEDSGAIVAPTSLPADYVVATTAISNLKERKYYSAFLDFKTDNVYIGPAISEEMGLGIIRLNSGLSTVN